MDAKTVFALVRDQIISIGPEIYSLLPDPYARKIYDKMSILMTSHLVSG